MTRLSKVLSAFIFAGSLLILWMVVNSICSHLAGGLKRDEVEFLHSAWLISNGLRPFLDFFQHHSPLYLQALSWFSTPAPELEWVLHVRFACALLACVSAGLAAALTIRAAVPTAHFSAAMAVACSIIFLALTAPFPIFEIRPEALATPLFLAAWFVAERSTASTATSRLYPAAFGLFSGLAIAMTPRAGLPTLALILSMAIANPRRPLASRLSYTGICGIWCTIVCALSLLSVSSPGPLFDWVYRFSRSSVPLSPLFDTIALSTFAWLLAPIAVGLAVALLLDRKRGQDLHLTGNFQFPVLVLLCALAGLWLEPRQFGQSLTFVLTAAAVCYARMLVLLLVFPSNKHAESSPTRRIGAGVAIAAAGVLAIVGKYYFDLASQYRNTSVTHRSDEQLLTILSGRVRLPLSVRARAEFCKRHPHELVLVEPTELHPVCLRDASYYWRGAEYLSAGTLQRAGIAARPFDPLTDLRAHLPIAVGWGTLRHGVSTQTQPIQALLSQHYKPVNGIYLRRNASDAS